MKILLRIHTTVFLLLLVVPFALSQQTKAAEPITWTPVHLTNGSPSLFSIELPQRARSVAGKWQGHDISFFHGKDAQHWYALVGIDVEVASGTYPLTVEATLLNGIKQDLHRDVAVGSAPYAKVALTVPDKFVQPNAEALKQIEADKIVKDNAFANTKPAPRWSGDFAPPLTIAPKSDSFGTRRVFNGTLASVHRGLDYRAHPGTSVMAVNSGRVVLAQPLYYEGNCVVIDHGMGLMTVYMHLSKFKVTEGDTVGRGQLIALSGGTGRATGPHLHLGVRWQGAYLDPQKLFTLNLPTLEPISDASKRRPLAPRPVEANVVAGAGSP
ncbi:MAG TPA: M23 family metallopeptidase [Edaphobacter sp.]